VFQDFPTAYEWQMLNRTDDPNMGAGMIGYGSGNAYAAGTVGAKLNQWISVKDYGAVGNGSTNDAAAINAAIVAASALNATLHFPAGTYVVTPYIAQGGAESYYTALQILSNMHVVGYGATIKVSDNYSTDGSPKELAIFSSDIAVSNISFEGLTFDLNGANNKMSPDRPATYNRYDHAAIALNGPNGRADDVLVQNCTFKNTAGVCFLVCQLVAAGTTPTLGKRWVIKNNTFLNGGLDTDDHTSIYAWCEDVVADGNTFWEDSPYQTVGKTGGATGYEIHGVNQRVVNNLTYNYNLGMYVAGNYTNPTQNILVSNNTFWTQTWGIQLYRDVNMTPALQSIQISNNTFYFDDTAPVFAGGAYSAKIGVYFFGSATGSLQQYSASDIKIIDNYAVKFGTTYNSQFVRLENITTVAAQAYSNVRVVGNSAKGFCDGVYIQGNATNALGYVEVARNEFISNSPGGSGTVFGVYADATGGIGTLVIDSNRFIDERGGGASFAYGIYLNNGTIADLWLGRQTYKGLTVSNYTEAGGITITNRLGFWSNTGATGSIATGTAITHGLPATPTSVMLQALDGTPTTVYPSAIGAAQFTVNFAGGGSHAFAWHAFIGNPFP
jgi:hypothetical protein